MLREDPGQVGQDITPSEKQLRWQSPHARPQRLVPARRREGPRVGFTGEGDVTGLGRGAALPEASYLHHGLLPPR